MIVILAVVFKYYTLFTVGAFFCDTVNFYWFSLSAQVIDGWYSGYLAVRVAIAADLSRTTLAKVG